MENAYTNEVDEIEQALHQINKRLSLEQMQEIRPHLEKLARSAVSMDTEIAKLNGKIRKRESEIEQAKEYCCDVLCLYRESWEGDNESLIEKRCNKCRMSKL
jgi:chromosome segregation ATPase